MAEKRYSIGQFARMTALSPGALRIYDRMGILRPALVNPATGYRYYTAGQLEKAALVSLFRKLDVPLPEIRDLVCSEDVGSSRELLRRHELRLQRRLASITYAIDRLERALGPDHELPPGRVALCSEEPKLVISGRTFAHVSAGDVIEYNAALEGAVALLEARLTACGLHALGREIVLHHNQTAWYEGLDIEVCIPLPRCASLVVDDSWVLPAATVASTRHLGPWSEVWASYASLLAWIDREGYEVCGPFRATYLVDERDTRDSNRYAADIRVPVRPAG